jgi:Flp pilus assembly protein TadG
MISLLRRLFRSSDATAAVEAAIFAPIFLTLTLGVTDLGTGMYVRMTVNAATQSGAIYAVIKHGSTCASLTAACISGIQTAMNDAVGNSSFCNGSVCPQPVFQACADPNGGICFVVTANYPFTPILPDAAYSWASLMTVSSTTTVRVQ